MQKKLRLKIGLVPEVVSLNEELVLLDGVGFTVLQMDYGSRHGGQTLDDDFGYLLPEELQLIVHRGLVRDTRFHLNRKVDFGAKHIFLFLCLYLMAVSFLQVSRTLMGQKSKYL